MIAKKLVFSLVALFLVLSCDPAADEEDGGRVFTDADIQAPVVSCPDAVPDWEFRSFDAPGPERVIDFSFTDADRGIVVGDRGIISRTLDGGATWNRLANGLTDAILTNISRPTPSTLYVTGSYESSGGSGAEPSPVVVLRSDNDGADWTKTYIDTFVSAADIRFETKEIGLGLFFERSDSIDYRPGLYRTTDGGQSWSQVDYPGEILGYQFVELEGELAIQGYEGVAVSQGGTDRWEIRSFPAGASGDVYFDGLRTGLISSTNTGMLYRTTDAGRNWELAEGPPIGISPVYLSAGGDGLVIRDRAEIVGGDVLRFVGNIFYSTTDGGATWSPLKTDGDCGYGRSLREVAPGRLMSIGQRTVVLDRG